MRQVPNADHFTGTDPTTPWGRHHLHRSYRRVLAYSDNQTPYPLPWLQAGKPGVLVQDFALRAQHSSKGVHKVGGYYNPTTKEQRRSSRGLYRRLDSLGVHSRRLPSLSPNSHGILGGTRVQGEPQEISAHSSFKVRVAGNQLGFIPTHPLSSTPEEEVHSQALPHFSQEPQNVSPCPGENPRIPPVRVSDRPSPQGQAQGCESSLVEPCQQEAPGQESSSSLSPSAPSDTMVDCSQSFQVGSPPLPPAVSGHSHLSLIHI